MDLQVRCINKSNRTSPHERILNIGGLYSNGLRWKKSEDVAIAEIKGGTSRFYVSTPGSSVWVVIATREGREYLKTEADGETPNNLLSLPECP